MTAKITNSVCCVILLCVLSFTSKAQLTAKFSSNNQSGCSPLVVQFNDESSGSPIKWKWDLGNGTTSFLKNPSVTYFTPGKYSVKLVAENKNGIDSVIKEKYIIVFDQPVAAFKSNITEGCFPLKVQFSDLSTAGSDTLNSWQWDFGDGYYSTERHPSHIYRNAGSYNVTLKVVSVNGCSKTISIPQYIKINDGVTANFSVTNPNACKPPITVPFTNLSTSSTPLTYQWYFGDGSTSIAENPVYTYNSSDSFTIKLIATNINGCTDTIIKKNAVLIKSVKASFNVKDTICIKTPTLITNTSSPLQATCAWAFSDGNVSTFFTPIKTFNAAGSYKIQLAITNGVCKDTATKTIFVSDKPVAKFIAADTSSCKTPFKVNFTNQSLNVSSYQWNFGDGGTSTEANPSHTYDSSGKFNVQLIVTNSAGCTDTLLKKAYIKIQPPTIKFAGLKDSSCATLTKKFSASLDISDPVVSYFWDLGDGKTSTLANPVNTYDTGVYNITAILTTATGCADTATINEAIIVTNKPVVNFEADLRDVCAKTPIKFSDLSQGRTTKWLWEFGDGTKSILKNPTHNYLDTGYFDVKLTAWNRGCADTIQFVKYIHINPPIAAFTVDFSCKKPYNRIFTDQSIGADEWKWNFGDGQTSIEQNPVHVYSKTGKFTVSLTVKNNQTGCEFTYSTPIDIVDLKAQFQASDTSVCKGQTITFSTPPADLVNVRSYTWNFGDGNSKVVYTANTTYAYNKVGTYTVSLISIDKILGCRDTLIRDKYITVTGPTAKFSTIFPSACTNSNVIIKDSSISDGTNALQTWIWNYGDNKKDTLTSSSSVQHSYPTSGNYTISLKIIDTNGCTDSVKQTSPLIISKPTAKFTAPDTISCPGKQLKFVNQSTGNGLSYLWNFGDGQISTAKDTTHAFENDGYYSIKLNVTDQYGCKDSMLKTSYIGIKTAVANFSMSDSISTCPPLMVFFNNQSVNDTTLHWDFGDGSSSTIANPAHFYTYPGTYTIKLTATSKGGCNTIKEKQVKILGPTGTIEYGPINGCKPLTVNFKANTQNTSFIIWDFRDGTTENTINSTTKHSYIYNGTYVPRMILNDNAGCSVPIIGKDTIRINGIDANFGFDKKLLCDSGIVKFSDSSVSSEAISQYNWSFGDGNTSNLKNPTHLFTVGTYLPKLIATSASGCKDTIVALAPIKVSASPKPVISNNLNGCAPLNETFNGALAIADTSAIKWNWNLGNGNSSTLQNPPQQTYTVAGLYNITLTATNSSGCIGSDTKTIESYAIPNVSAGNDTIICAGSNITLNATGADTYVWSPAYKLSCTNCNNPVATPATTSGYLVKGTTIHGCSSSDTITIGVKQKMLMRYSPPDTICLGEGTQLVASGTHSYRWSPETGLNNATIAEPTATPNETTTYQVIGTDELKCFNDTGYVAVKVYPIPTVEAGENKTINVGQSIDLIPQISDDVTEVIWSPTGAIYRNEYPGITVQPRETTEYTVEVCNSGKCKAKDRVTIFVVCNGGNVFIPNTFSPNGDGMNDIFYPRGTGLYNVKNFRIFNRWGEVVFEKSNFAANNASAGWDGTFRGKKLNADVFVYTIEIICDNNNTVTFKGNVALIQ